MDKKMNEEKLKKKNALLLIEKWIAELEGNEHNREVKNDVTDNNNE
ncbi:hypothetical protein ACLM5H_19385 [Fredinandcohnia humi]